MKVYDVDSGERINTVSTGGLFRADEMAIGDKGRALLVVNNADAPAFMTLISTKPGNAILFSHVTVPGATGGIEQPVWARGTKRFYISVPQLNDSPTDGGVAVFNPKTGMVEQVFHVPGCQPNGIALGPHQHLLLGCANRSGPTTASSTITNAKDGTIVATIPQVGASDEVWFNRGDERYYLAARQNPAAQGGRRWA
ncbi:MAG TPA: hypothetical protein VK138_06835 [Acidiferrobacterales bacterium]|nr:hypothetical protein [Acidiferrobacterales bacterium]